MMADQDRLPWWDDIQNPMSAIHALNLPRSSENFAAFTGIAMGAAGTEMAIEIEDIALMADDLKKISFAINISRRA
jgi:hypothetical protein